MGNVSLVIPLISTLCGLVIAVLLKHFILRRVPLVVESFVVSVNDGAFENIQPLVESQIDNFLRHKLSKAMPMLSMFIGEKTIIQLKTVFMKELEEIFPGVMGKYTSRLTPLVTSALRAELRLLPFAGAVAGLLTGLFQLLAIAVVQ